MHRESGGKTGQRPLEVTPTEPTKRHWDPQLQGSGIAISAPRAARCLRGTGSTRRDSWAQGQTLAGQASRKWGLAVPAPSQPPSFSYPSPLVPPAFFPKRLTSVFGAQGCCPGRSTVLSEVLTSSGVEALPLSS